ncbi:MAG: hypothetical protein WC736_14590 [Gallionella sp.]|jgi:hypothetical protein
MEIKSFNGLRSDRPVERFDPADLSIATNVDIDNSGAISRRDGYAIVGSVPAGAKHSLWADDSGTIGLYVSGTVLYSIAGVALLTGLTAGLPMAYHRELDRVYFSNGAQSGVLDNGVVRSWGLPVPTTPAVTLTVGNMPAGGYQFTLTYFRNDGQESGAALSGRVAVPEGGGLVFTLPVSSDPTVTTKGVYLSTPNGDVKYLALVVPNATTSVSYTNDAKELVTPLITQFLSGPPAGHLIRSYRGQVYVAVDDTLYPSEPYAYELFDLRNGIPLDGRVALFEALDDVDGSGVFVGTDRTCGILVGKGPADFEYVKKTAYGAIVGTSVRVDGSLYGDNSLGARQLPVWQTTQGVCVGLPKMSIRNLTRTRYTVAATGRGAGIFIPASNRLILTSNL